MKKSTVVDASVILAVVLGESQKRRLEELTLETDLMAPISLKARSPLAIRGIKTKITAKEIVDIVREVRHRN